MNKDVAHPYRWILLILGWLTYASFGFVFASYAPLVSAIMRDLHLSHEQLGFILGSWQLVYVFSATVIGLATDRFGARIMIGVGISIITLSGLLRAIASSYPMMFLAVALFGVGGPAVSIGLPKLVAVWFENKERRIAIGIAQTGPSVGTVLAIASVNSVLIPWLGNWRFVFLFFALVAGAVAVTWWALSREPAQLNMVGNSQLSFANGLKEILKVRNAWVIAIVGVAHFLLIHGLTNWLPTIIENAKVSAAQAGFFASIPSAVGIPAAVVIPRLIPEHKRKYFAGLLFCLASVSTIVIGSYGSGDALLSALVVQGAAINAVQPVLFLILMNTRRINSVLMGVASGLYFTVGEVGGFAGPSILGVSAELTGSFLPGLWTMSIFSLAIVLPLILLVQEESAKVSSSSIV